MWPDGTLSRRTFEFVSRLKAVVRPAASSIRMIAPNRSTWDTVTYPRASVIRARTVSAPGAVAGVVAVAVIGRPTACQGVWAVVEDTVPVPEMGTLGYGTDVGL